MDTMWMHQDVNPYFDTTVFFKDIKKEQPLEPSNLAVSLHLGSTGEETRKIQMCLKRLGYYTGSVDGIFGMKTKQGVERFQREQHLKVDGIVGPKTSSTLQRICLTKTQKEKQGQPILHLGNQNTRVKELQQQLQRLGYYQELIDGIFGMYTKQAVERFQRDQGLVADGIVGIKTWKALDTVLQPMETMNVSNTMPLSRNKPYSYDALLQTPNRKENLISDIPMERNITISPNKIGISMDSFKKIEKQQKVMPIQKNKDPIFMSNYAMNPSLLTKKDPMHIIDIYQLGYYQSPISDPFQCHCDVPMEQNIYPTIYCSNYPKWY